MKLHYFNVTDSARNFTVTEEVRQWLIGGDHGLGILAYMLDRNPDLVEPVIPEVALIPESPSSIRKLASDGVPDYLTVGRFQFVSEKLKNLFDSHQVDAYYSKAHLEVASLEFEFHLFAPRRLIHAIHREKSVYEIDPDDEPEDNGLMRIQTIEKLVVDESVVPDAVSLYWLGGTYQFVQVVSRELASALLESELTGFSVKPIDEGEWLV